MTITMRITETGWLVLSSSDGLLLVSGWTPAEGETRRPHEEGESEVCVPPGTFYLEKGEGDTLYRQRITWNGATIIDADSGQVIAGAGN